MLAIGIFITHGLACYVAIDITWNDYVGKKIGNSPHKLLWEYVVRTLLVLVTCKLSNLFKFILKFAYVSNFKNLRVHDSFVIILI